MRSNNPDCHRRARSGIGLVYPRHSVRSPIPAPRSLRKVRLRASGLVPVCHGPHMHFVTRARPPFLEDTHITTRLVAFDADASAIEFPIPRIVNHGVDFPALSGHYQAQLYRRPTVREVDRSCSRAIRIDGIGAAAGVPLLVGGGAPLTTSAVIGSKWPSPSKAS